MKRLILPLLGLIALTPAWAQDDPAELGSLHRPGRGGIESRVAGRKGDLLTILVSETTTANFSATTTGTKTVANTVNQTVAPILNWLKIPLLSTIFGAMSNGASSNESGAGTTTTGSRFTAKITVLVKEVRPNGVLVVEGQRAVQVNKETVNITLSGLVRRDDVRGDNTVLSENVADVQIKSAGSGMVADRQRKGALTRLLEWLF